MQLVQHTVHQAEFSTKELGSVPSVPSGQEKQTSRSDAPASSQGTTWGEKSCILRYASKGSKIASAPFFLHLLRRPFSTNDQTPFLDESGSEPLKLL
jgi:hypothetical protein